MPASPQATNPLLLSTNMAVGGIGGVYVFALRSPDKAAALASGAEVVDIHGDESIHRLVVTEGDFCICDNNDILTLRDRTLVTYDPAIHGPLPDYDQAKLATWRQEYQNFIPPTR